MNKLYCDFCGDEITLHWDKVNDYKMTVNIHSEKFPNASSGMYGYDICRECFSKLQHMAVNKDFKKEQYTLPPDGKLSSGSN